MIQKGKRPAPAVPRSLLSSPSRASMQSWVTEELDSADLGDKRLNARYRLILDRLSLKPSLKFTAACNGRNEVEAAYKFVNHPRITPDLLLKPHHDSTLQRIRQHNVFIIAPATTENDLTRPHEQVEGG